jgi:hypothetical protein
MQLTLPSGLSVFVNMYQVGDAPNYAIGNQVGDNYNGTASGSPAITYTFDLESQGAGDYWCQLFIVGVGQGVYFPVRNNVARPYMSWEDINLITLVDDVVVTNVTQPTDADVKLVRPIRIGDDYVDQVGRAWKFDVNGITGYAAADLTCKFGGKLNGVGWDVTGTVSTITGGVRLQFDLPKSATQSLEPGWYAFSAEINTVVGGYEVTRVAGKVQLVEKQS